MSYLHMLCHHQILQDSSTGRDTISKVFYAKAFQSLYFKVFQQLLPTGSLIKHPVFQLESIIFIAEVLFKQLSFASLEDNLFRGKVTQQFVDIFIVPLSCKELACRNIQESDAYILFAEMDGTQEIVLLVVQHIIIDSHTRCHQLSDASLHQLLR